jgi:formate hydrogenlyase subunit 3/multisubunit Na+/H+ antiporter MnhD subunit
MSAPFLWISLPLIVGALLGLSPDRRRSAVQGGGFALLLALVALIVPIDTAMALGGISVKLSATLLVLGRSFNLERGDGPVLALIYGSLAIWFFGSTVAATPRRFVGLGLAIVALLVASIAVEPFLFAAPLFEMAAMLAIPLLVSPGIQAGRAILRFLTYQTLAVPLILLAGWMLAGVEASPGDIILTAQATVMLGVGFAFLLAVFPLYNWIPMLATQGSPYTLGFLLWALHSVGLVFALGFLDRYAWLRTSPQLLDAILFAGAVMVASGGWFAAFERHAGRMLAFVAVAETGASILALSLGTPESVQLVFLILLPRSIELVSWAAGLSILAAKSTSLRFGHIQGLARSHPIAAGAVVLAHLSMVGLPLLAGFPSRLMLWQGLAARSAGLAAIVLLGVVGLTVGAMRTLAVLTMAPENTGWKSEELSGQSLVLGITMAALLLLGILPQGMNVFAASLSRMFEHFGP